METGKWTDYHLGEKNTNAQMFTEDGKFANGYLTVKYACLYCYPAETKQWALKYAKGVHTIEEK